MTALISMIRAVISNGRTGQAKWWNVNVLPYELLTQPYCSHRLFKLELTTHKLPVTHLQKFPLEVLVIIRNKVLHHGIIVSTAYVT